MLFQKREKLFAKLTAFLCTISIVFGSLASAQPLFDTGTMQSKEPVMEQVAPEETGTLPESSPDSNGITPFYLPADENEPNDTKKIATDITPSYNVSFVQAAGNFHSMNDIDWFKITFDNVYDANFYVGNFPNGYINLYPPGRTTPIKISSNNGIIQKAMMVELGDYYLELVGDPSESDTDGYFMEISFSKDDDYEPNNTFNTAYSFGSRVAASIESTIHASNDYDYYKVTMPYSGTAQFYFESALYYSYQLNVLDSQKNYVAQNVSFEEFKVKKGETYYMEVCSPNAEYSNNDFYHLNYYLFNDSINYYTNGDPIPIDPISESPFYTVEDCLDYEDDYSIYQITIPRDGTLSIDFLPPEYGGYEMNVYHINLDSYLDTFYNIPVKAGDKFGIKVFSKSFHYDPENPFTLQIHWETFDEYEPNDTLSQATIISDNINFNTVCQINASSHSSEDIDYYKIIPNKDKKLLIEVPNTIKFVLLDKDGKSLFKDAVSTYEQDVLQDETYYIKLSSNKILWYKEYTLTIESKDIVPSPSPTPSPTPVVIPTPMEPMPIPTLAPASEQNNFVQVAGGGFHTLALKGDGTVWAWGDNTSGQLGTGNNLGTNIPHKVVGLADIVAISTRSDHNLALKSDGTVWAWGTNTYGELGDGNVLTTSNIPVQVTGLTDIVSVCAGHNFSLALKTDGTVYSWGNNKTGQLGIGSTYAFFKTPQKIDGLFNIIQISAGHNHALALNNERTAWAWGKNKEGALGDGTTNNSTIPLKMKEEGVFAVSAGVDCSFLTVAEINIHVFGDNTNGQLGNGNSDSRCAYTVLDGGDNWEFFWYAGFISSNNTTSFINFNPNSSAGGYNTLYMAGLNSNGQFGNSNYQSFRYNTLTEVPLENLDIQKLKQVSQGSMHTVLLLDGEVYCAGRNQKSQCAVPPRESVTSFTKVSFEHQHQFTEGEITYRQLDTSDYFSFIWERVDTCSICGETSTASGKHEHDPEITEYYYDKPLPEEEGCLDFVALKCKICEFEYENMIHTPHTYKQDYLSHFIEKLDTSPNGYEHQDFIGETCVDCGYSQEYCVSDIPTLLRVEDTEHDGKYYEVFHFDSSCGRKDSIEFEIDHAHNWRFTAMYDDYKFSLYYWKCAVCEKNKFYLDASQQSNVS